MKKIPELSLKCCGRTRKPQSIKLLDDYIRITFYCPYCRRWLYLETKNGMKKMSFNVEIYKQTRDSSYIHTDDIEK